MTRIRYMARPGVNRRQFIKQLALLAGVFSLSSCRVSLREGLRNPCLSDSLSDIHQHPLWQKAWQDIDPAQLWDCHCHLVGVGDSDSGIEVNDALRSWWHPIQHTQFNYYLNASCAEGDALDLPIDLAVVKRLEHLATDFKPGYKMMLLAFERYYDEQGKHHPEYSVFHVPNQYAAKIASQHPTRFEWIASIHPYRKDALEELRWCVEHGAKAIKWLPGAMGINPSSPRCDEFYHALVEHKLPLLSHTGSEHAVETPAGQRYNNPLLLRRPLQTGVKVIASHCASVGEFVDLDVAVEADEVSAYQLFKRVMHEHAEDANFYGDISAITFANHDTDVIEDLIVSKELHDNLIYGSDYPLPGILPLVNTRHFVDRNWITPAQSEVLMRVRRSNALLYDFLLKRLLAIDGQSLPATVFHSRRLFV